MKVLTVNQIREGDAFTIANEPISSIDLMERAALQCTNWIIDNYDTKQPICIFSGPGNNGGDGLAIARMLKANSYNIKVNIVEYTKGYSFDFKINLERLKELDISINLLTEENYEIKLDKSELVIDCIFGSGLSRPISGFVANIISDINNSSLEVISIDIASGLIADKLSEEKNPIIIIPRHTLSLAFPKVAFFLPENEAYVGQWHNIDIGIHIDFQNSVKAFAYNLLKNKIKPIIKNRSKYAHKGNFGHALLIAGSYGKIGAAVIASKATLRTGLGLLTTHTPSCGVNILQTAAPEAMLSIDSNSEFFSAVPDLSAYNAIGIGPGLGTKKESQLALKLLIQNAKIPLVIDADALNILSENKTWLAFLPAGSILTPHPKEFDRLTGNSSSSLVRIEKQKDLSIKHNIFIILKGANTSISTPEGNIFFNSTGNPGMATAGSGDVLTGIVLSLMAQNYTNQSACILGTYLHGLAGDIAAMDLGFESLLASDIISYLPKAFINLQS